MKAETVIEVVKTLVGDVEAWGETYHDDKAYENLDVMIDVCNALLDDIYEASKTKGRVEYSMNKIGNHAYGFLEDLKEWCNWAIKEKQNEIHISD